MPRAATTSDVFNAIAEPRRRDILDLSRADGASGQRHRRRVRAVPAVGVEAPQGAARGRTGRGAPRRPADVLSHQRRGPEAACTNGRERSIASGATSCSRVKERASGAKEAAVTLTASTVENLTLNVEHEVHVRASLSATFEALLEEMGPANDHARRAGAADGDRSRGRAAAGFATWATTTATSGATFRPSSGRRCWRLPVRSSCRLPVSRTCSTG